MVSPSIGSEDIMLRETFPRGHARYEQCRAAEELERFGAWLVAAGYSRYCVRGHLFRLRDALGRSPAADLIYTVVQLRRAFGTRVIRTRRSMLYRATQRAYQRFLASQGRLATAPSESPFAAICDDYRRELLEVRGLSPETVAQHERTIAEFLGHALGGARSLQPLTAVHVDRYLDFKGQKVCRHRLQHVIAHLRSFLGFCRVVGRLEQPLEVIDSVRIHRDELPPKALPWPLVLALLRSIDRASRSGWRDYAVLHLASHYGLRPSEVVSLRLDSIDWDVKVLKVQQCKTRSVLLLPLADRTLSILQEYLQRGRPKSSHPQLFLRARCPAGALMRYAVSDIFETRAARGGLPVDGYSVYSLRHAFAMRLLERGVGVKAIGDLLGHRNLASTCQYLRLEIDMLRGVALPVPRQTQK